MNIIANKIKLDVSYLDTIGKMVIELNYPSLTTYVLTNTALKIAYNKIELSKVQLELFEADVKAAKLNGMWDYSEEEKTIKNYLKNLEIQKMVEKLSISEQLKFYIEKYKKVDRGFGFNLSETEIIEKANRMLNNKLKGGIC